MGKAEPGSDLHRDLGLIEQSAVRAAELTRQLLAFARIFLRNPGLVILDEASSRLDPATEVLIERAVDHLLEDLHEDPGESELARLRPAIDRLFSDDSVEEILSRLDAETGELAEWAQGAAADIRRMSPLSLKVAFR